VSHSLRDTFDYNRKLRFHPIVPSSSPLRATVPQPHAWRRVRHRRRVRFRSARYEANGNVAAIEDANGVVTKAAYNAIGQRGSVNDPNQGSWSFVYNALGEVLNQTDAHGIVTSMSYDKLGRPLTRNASIDVTGDNVADTVADAWSYDPANAKGAPLSEQRSINGTLERSNTQSYDALARPIQSAIVFKSSWVASTRDENFGDGRRRVGR
jgi:YD repeat-containing protein